jgi:hypothetical protein
MESPFSLKTLSLVQMLFITAIMLMVGSVAMSMVAMLETMQKNSDNLEKLVTAAMIENTSYDINVVEHSGGSAEYFAIPLPGLNEAEALEEYKLNTELQCTEPECPDSIEVKLIRTVLDEQTILRDTMLK